MVAADVSTIVYGTGEFAEMLAVVVDATHIGDSAAGVGVVAIGAAVFRDLDGKFVVLGDALDDVVHAGWVDLPADLGKWAFFAVTEIEAHGCVGWLCRDRSCGGSDESAEVVVDADIVEWGHHALVVAALEAHRFEGNAVDKSFGIVAA